MTPPNPTTHQYFASPLMFELIVAVLAAGGCAAFGAACDAAACEALRPRVQTHAGPIDRDGTAVLLEPAPLLGAVTTGLTIFDAAPLGTALFTIPAAGLIPALTGDAILGAAVSGVARRAAGLLGALLANEVAYEITGGGFVC